VIFILQDPLFLYSIVSRPLDGYGYIRLFCLLMSVIMPKYWKTCPPARKLPTKPRNAFDTSHSSSLVLDRSQWQCG